MTAVGTGDALASVWYRGVINIVASVHEPTDSILSCPLLSTLSLTIIIIIVIVIIAHYIAAVIAIDLSFSLSSNSSDALDIPSLSGIGIQAMAKDDTRILPVAPVGPEDVGPAERDAMHLDNVRAFLEGSSEEIQVS
jgi:hypothetical protein